MHKWNTIFFFIYSSLYISISIKKKKKKNFEPGEEYAQVEHHLQAKPDLNTCFGGF